MKYLIFISALILLGAGCEQTGLDDGRAYVVIEKRCHVTVNTSVKMLDGTFEGKPAYFQPLFLTCPK